MLRIVLFVLSLFPFILSAQVKGDYIWLGGLQPLPNGGVDGHIYNFNEKDMQPEGQVLGLGHSGNSTSICDEDGNLLFYFNGQAVLNKDHEIVPNGDSINSGLWTEIFWSDPTYGYPGFQDCIILKDPEYNLGYYLFHTTNIYYPLPLRDSLQFRYTYIDLALDNGKGDVIIKNERIYEHENLLYCYFTAIKHTNKDDWWLVRPILGNYFLTYLINSDGIIRQPDQDSHVTFDRERSSASGTAKFSPDGTKYALYNYYDQLHLYDFDRSTGLLSNHRKIFIYPQGSVDRDEILFSSVEWSPNSRFIYTANSLNLHQVDTWEEDIQDGIRLIDTYNGTLDPFQTAIFLMVQGPDCKIYVSPKNGAYSIHVINKPDELGTACDFVQNGIKLPNTNSGTLPNFPRFRVDEEEKCDPTLVSVFGHTVYYRRNIEVYPNPSTGVFHIVKPDEMEEGILKVMDQNGREVYQTQMGGLSQSTKIDISSFPSGMYLLEIFPENNTERIFYSAKLNKM